jgi:hypothetical protein
VDRRHLKNQPSKPNDSPRQPNFAIGSREYVRVVEAYRDRDGKARHRTVINLGRRDVLAEHLDLGKLRHLLHGDAAGDDRVAHKDIGAVGAWDWGPLLAARRMWSDLGLDTTPDQLARPDRREDQGIDLKPCVTASGVLTVDADQNVASRLRTGLRAAGANSRVGPDPEAFAADVKLRPMPFPGLSSFGDDDADAALFYGRSREIAHILEDLRSMRAVNDQRPLVIQGASGAGKSSLLKAVIPRLRREAPAWLPLRAFRPGADPLLNFAEALARTFADFGRTEAHGVIRDRLMGAWSKAKRADKGDTVLEAALETEGRALRTAADRPNASILISVERWRGRMTRAARLWLTTCAPP